MQNMHDSWVSILVCLDTVQLRGSRRKQCCESGFIDGQKLGKKYSGKVCLFDEKIAIYWASLKGVQATGEAFRSQRRTSSTSKTEIY
jgi:hypothetical protein